MVLRELKNKMLALGITISMITLIFLVLIPSPSIAVYLSPGAPSSTSVNTASTITFNNVNFTIRGSEAIPVNYLNFSIRRSSNNQQIANVTFYINGTEKSDPLNKFTITPITNTSNLPYQPSGNYYGYDERTGANYTFDYGYGYGTTTSLTILYTIRYTTHTTGTFYAQLYVTGNTTVRTYVSGSSTPFTVSSPSSPGGGGSSGDVPTANTGGPYTGVVGTLVLFDGSKSTAVSGTTISSYTWVFGDGTTSVGIRSSHTYLTAGTYTVRLTVADNTGAANTASTTATISPAEPSTPSVTVSNQTLQTIKTNYGVTLEKQFYASDTNGDGKVDMFTDPNNLLTPVSLVNISGHTTFLISTNNDDIPEFFWDTATNTMTPITHTPTPLTNPFIDPTEKTLTIEITVNKTGWIYLDITDQYPIEEYPQYTFTVKTGNRAISSDRIWRKNGKIYVLDDPATSYDLIYGYTILPPTFYPLSGTTLTILRPTITIYYQQPVYILVALLDAKNIIHDFTTLDNKVFTYTPTTDLTKGSHTLSLTVQDDQGIHTLTSTSTYIASHTEEPLLGLPLIIAIIIAIILIVAFLVVILRIYAFI